ncbi:hypothetical protein OH214_11280 [Idiomarina abyssalis]|uniref:hypothetical protein n=1 Tax=Idiomarina abyssalis TaxID=86102 RepID=UPI002300E104|nr:hypothetical protein [Idiomarina abyssalis]MDA6067717.1 hypothetical protein [Idiomarina abyssalis]
MEASWKFERKRRSQKSRDPMQASFFTNASIDEDAQALIRELIQNSLDANVSPEPVRVRLSIGKHEPESGIMKQYISDNAWEHFNASDNGLESPPRQSDPCRFLVYEDFNTSGLVGDETVNDEEPRNSFYYFMRAEGQSGKEDGVRGRHGIGKYVVPKASGIRMFIAVTVRNSDQRCLIAGQSVLKSHHVDGVAYTPDAWWGVFEEEGDGDDYFPMPVESEALFNQVVEHFNLTRSLTDTGLSLIMPYIQEDISIKTLSKYVVNEYFWPILNGQLLVEVTEV